MDAAVAADHDADEAGCLAQWRKSRGGRGGHVPLENWTAGDSNALCPPPQNLASNLVLYKACLV